MSSVEEDDYDTLTDIDSDKNVIRTKVWYPHAGKWGWVGAGPSSCAPTSGLSSPLPALVQGSL